MTSLSSPLERDFTVEGRKGPLACPFSAEPKSDKNLVGIQPADKFYGPAETAVDSTPHKSSDPICAAMFEEAASVPAQAASKCPIRFLDKHSPEEIARYVETHKHEIPRSHEVCVRRYQKNEEQIRKLDAKYGNLVSMIKDLSHLHQPMLPSALGEEVDRSSNRRVENWAQTVTLSEPEPTDEVLSQEDRESRFDRPLRDVRVGESPSRPWGISIPPAAGFPADGADHPASPPPAPVRMHSPRQAPTDSASARKCPFDFTKLAFPPPLQRAVERADRNQVSDHGPEAAFNDHPQPRSLPRPTFLNLSDMVTPKAEKAAVPQVVLNISGPVFIGYPMEQAIEFMQRLAGQ